MRATKEDQILLAAKSLFVRFGFEKMTMNDIAREAGVARQTVYNRFDSKDAIFMALVRARMAELRSDLHAAWTETDDIPSFLDAFLRVVPIAWFDEASSFSDPGEMIDRLHRLAEDQMQAFAKEVITDIAARLGQGHAFKSNQITAQSFAENFYWSTVNAKYGAPDRDAFMTRIETTRAMALMVLDA
ncbi:MAG: helix-turn-helix domain containing protein [Litoreibacter sp.]|nr:helix-turn-helix domain containing protein [Litoreibacter sp.]